MWNLYNINYTICSLFVKVSKLHQLEQQKPTSFEEKEN